MNKEFLKGIFYFSTGFLFSSITTYFIYFKFFSKKPFILKWNNNDHKTIPEKIEHQIEILEKNKKQDILKFRNEFLPKCLKPSYGNEPIFAKFAQDQFIYDLHNVKYLDCYNNVAHIGHCQFNFCNDVSKQLKTFNSNTRYLHENISTLLKMLIDTMPKNSGLKVCFFVNSGSEANYLAIRLVRSFTGKRKILFLRKFRSLVQHLLHQKFQIQFNILEKIIIVLKKRKNICFTNAYSIF